jgi:AraC-like DNA-binding protein
MDRPVVGRGGAEVEAEFELVHADTLRFFPELVAELGGDADALLREAGVERASLSAALRYRAVADLLELAATKLEAPDVGLRLALLQGGARAFGPMGVVMANSKTFGEALEYVASHVHAYTLAARVRLQRERETQRVAVPIEILLDRLPHKQQAMEQALLLGHLNAVESTGGVARVREVRFRHRPLSPLRVYRQHFGCEVRFDQEMDALVFAELDLHAPIVDPDVQLYEMATCFIDAKFTRVAPPMHARVRGLILQYLGGEECTNERVAAELALHPRTLHRRLKEEGTSFEAIKDEVRRDVALRYLQHGDLPLTRIAEKLGYAETSVLSRSCFRWFAASPRQLRAQARLAATSGHPLGGPAISQRRAG